MTLHHLTNTELEDLLMKETKRFTAALHDGTSQEQKDSMRERIDEMVALLEKRKQGNDEGITGSEL